MLAERWNGMAWVIQKTPSPSGAYDSELAGVSCTLASACTAAGDYHNSGGTRVTLAERWNGTAWVIQTTPSPSGAEGSLLKGVSCTSVSACTAVGDYATSDDGIEVMLAERWNGTAWVIQTTPSPSGSFPSFFFDSELSGVSCTSASACTAAGDYATSSGIEVTLAERYT
jgi:hypothetical protein